MARAVHIGTRVSRGKVQRGYRRTQKSKNGGYALI
jgi:hypothetical protein